MNGWDILIIAILAAVLMVVIFLMIRRKKRGRSCCGDCMSCISGGMRGTKDTESCRYFREKEIR